MVLALSVAIGLLGAAPTYPEDPFADEYRVPSSSEVGLGAGQLRPMLLGGASPGAGAVMRGTTEYLPGAYFGLRGSLELQLAVPADRLTLHSARAGASVHLLPYRRVDVGVWFEGGPALVGGRLLPLLVGGLSADIGLSTLLFVHVDAQLGWA